MYITTYLPHCQRVDSYMKKAPTLNQAQNANFTELYYADDTICITNGAEAMQVLITEIEKTGAKFGLTLNSKNVYNHA